MRKCLLAGWLLSAWWVPTGLLAVGCGADSSAPLVSVDTSRQPEAFSNATNPLALLTFLNSHPTLNADALVPTSDLYHLISVPPSALPYSSTYWPFIDGGILARWQGPDIRSPAEKYGALFLTVPEQNELNNWINSHQGRGSPDARSWFGICQGWAGAAIAEPTPRRPITVRRVVSASGVTSVQECTGRATTDCISFTPGDLTALAAESYSQADNRLIGERCDVMRSQFQFDASGRVADASCRANAGTLFLIATNFIKLAKRAFVLNSTNNDQIWNQPAYAYRVTAYAPVTAQRAAQLLTSATSAYGFNAAAVGFRHVVMVVSWAKEAAPTVYAPPPLVTQSKEYEFILELDATGNVLGGEWIGQSRTDHPPFFWVPVAPGTSAPHLNTSYVKTLLALSAT